MYGEVIELCVCIYVYQCIYIFFFAFFSIMVYYRILNIVLGAMSCCLPVVAFFLFFLLHHKACGILLSSLTRD